MIRKEYFELNLNLSGCHFQEHSFEPEITLQCVAFFWNGNNKFDGTEVLRIFGLKMPSDKLSFTGKFIFTR